MSLHSTAAKSTGQCSKPCCSATAACAGDQSFEVPCCRTSTPGDSAHKIPMSLERCAAVPGQPGGNGAASQRDLLAMACTAILEMWRGGKEGSFLSLLHVPVLGEGTQSTGSPKPPFPREGSPGQAGPWLIWLQFPVADHPALSPLHLASTQAIALCHQEDGKSQHKKHHVALIRHVLIRLPPCSCFQPGQTFAAAAAKYSQPSSHFLMVVHIPVRASICRQQASHEQHAPRQAGSSMEVQTGHRFSSDGGSCNVFPTEVIFKLFIKGSVPLAAGWAIFGCLLHLSTKICWQKLSLFLPGTLRPPMVSEVCPAMVTAVCFLTRRGTF